jgi:cytochrome b involved in lipid metabolism
MRLSRLEVLTLVFVISVHLLAFLSSFLQFSNPPKKIEDVLQAELIPPPQTTQPEKKIPEAEWIQKLHWAHGVHTWRPLANSNLIYDQIQNPFPNIYICGETYSKNQGWIEGSLETSFEVIQKIIKSKENKVLKYTKSEVSKSNSLTIIENRVYDLAKINWLDKHPGGDIIKKAIGIDSTHIFKYISHPAYVMNILLDLYVGDLELK